MSRTGSQRDGDCWTLASHFSPLSPLVPLHHRHHRHAKSLLPRRHKSLSQGYRTGPRRTIYYPNGDTYLGHWDSDQKHGHGIYHWKAHGLRYEGEWKRDCMEGYGWMNDVREGRRLYFGGFVAGKFEGVGTLVMGWDESGEPNAVYEGEFVGGVKTGMGYYRSTNPEDGTVISYDGEWANDRWHGHGVYINGPKRYEGHFVNGLRHGRGTVILDGGRQIEAMWEEDMPVQGIETVDEAVGDLKLPSIGLVDLEKTLDRFSAVGVV